MRWAFGGGVPCPTQRTRWSRASAEHGERRTGVHGLRAAQRPTGEARGVEELELGAAVTVVPEPDRAAVRVGVRRPGDLPLTEALRVRLTRHGGPEVGDHELGLGLHDEHGDVGVAADQRG